MKNEKTFDLWVRCYSISLPTIIEKKRRLKELKEWDNFVESRVEKIAALEFLLNKKNN